MRKDIRLKLLPLLITTLFTTYSLFAFSIDCDLTADANGVQTICNADGSYDVCIDLIGINGVYEVVDHTNTATNIPGNFTIPLNGPFNQTVCLTYPNYNIYNFCVRGITQANSTDTCEISLDFIGAGMCCEMVCDDNDCTNGLETWDADSCSCVDNPPPAINAGTPQTICNADGSYKVCINITGYDGDFEVVDHTNTSTYIPNDFTLPINGTYNRTLCLTYPNNYIYNFCVREVVQTASGESCYISVDFIGSGICCEINCDDGICANGIETWDAVFCQCVEGTPYPSCSGSASIVVCDDGDPCTENDVQSVDDCDGSICIPCAGTPVPACTLQDVPLVCDDGDPCTENDVEILDICTGQICVPCTGTPIPSCTLQDVPVTCNDGDSCTENDIKILDMCTGQVCVPCAGTPIPSCSGSTSVVACNDNDDCTTNDLQTIDDCDGSVCVPCAGTPSCNDDNTPPEITLNWGSGIYSGIQLNMQCDDITYFNTSYVTVADNCDDAPTVIFTDQFIEYGDCNTTGYLSKWRCFWTATDECGNESVYEIFVTLTCPSCNDNNACTVDTYDGCDCVHEQIPNCGYQAYPCTYPQDFYGNAYSIFGGQTCSSLLNACLSTGSISVGLPGQSITIYSADCIYALLPSYGGVSLLSPGDLTYSGTCSYTPLIANSLAAHLLTLKLNICNNPSLASISINDQVGCILAPESVLVKCGGNYTVGQLCDIGDYALAGYYGNDQALLNDIYMALCLINDGFSFCGDPCVYVRENGNEAIVKNTGSDIEISQDNNLAFIQIAINLQQPVNNGSISILHVNGQVLQQQKFNGSIGYNQISINLNHLPVGIYFVVVETENGPIYLDKMMKL